MKKKATQQPPRQRKVKFSIKAPGAAQVMLMGDFNNWSPKAHPMKNDGNGIWSRTTTIPPGKYEYKFLIDGEWKEDPENQQTCSNCFGTLNNIIQVV